MPQRPAATRIVQPEDWFATYVVGVTALALVLALFIMLMMLAGTTPLIWAEVVPQTLFMGLLTFISSGFLISILAALPCALFFWLAQRLAWRHVLIYLFCGALGSLPTIPVVVSVTPSSFYIDSSKGQPLPDGLPRYLSLVPVFGGCGVFLGAIFWWRSGRHLR